MPPAPPDSPVGRASGPVGVARRTREARRPLRIGPSRPPAALEALLVDLGSQIQRGPSQASRQAADSPRFRATGLAALDRRLGGGFPCGRLSEICGAHSSGRTALALSLVAEALGEGLLVAWIDGADAFDPGSAAEALAARGGDERDLEHLLWVRARSEQEILRSSERLLRTEGFELIVLDHCPRFASPSQARGAASGRSGLLIRDVTWLRLARLAAGTRTALVTLSETPSTGSRSELVLGMEAHDVRFVGPPSLLDGIDSMALLLRHRSRPTGDAIPLSIRSEVPEARTAEGKG